MTRTLAHPLLLALLLLALPGLAVAQETGRLEVYAFATDGRPAEGLEVLAGGLRTTTGPDGVARLELPSGLQTLRIDGPGGAVTAQVPVVWGEVTEVIVRLGSEAGPPELVVEAPGWPADPSAPAPEEGPLGTLAGRVTDARQGAPVPGARVLVRGQLAEVVTDAAGAFQLPLPAGLHTVSVIHPEYTSATRGELRIEGGAVTTLELSLTPSSVQLDTFRVSGYRLEGGLAALLDERREERGVTEVLGAEQMSKSGDGDAASALRRVTGLTVVGGRYLYIRGMGERYASALLNGANLPSPNPERRVVPLDLFPTDVIESISVQKTYSPELPGEFGGGVARIRTKGIPDGLTGGFSVSGGFREGTTGQQGLTYSGGDLDWIGWDDGTRSLPDGVRVAAEREPVVLEDPYTGEGYPLAVLEGLGEAMPNTWSARSMKVPADLGFSASLGDRHELPVGDLGYRVGVSYGNKYKLGEGVQRVLGQGQDGELIPVVDYRREALRHSVDISALASIGYAPAEGHEIDLTTLWLRTTEDETERYQGLLGNDDTLIRVTGLRWIEEQLLSTQARGSHDLWHGVTLSWSYTYSLATRWQPDWRRTRYDLDPASGRYLLSNRPEGNQRLFNEVEDNTHDLSLSLDVPFEVWSDLTAHVQVGGAYLFRDRETATRRFKFIHRGPRSQDPDVLALRPEDVFTATNIGEDGFSFEEITRATDNYLAEQTITAAFLNLVLPLHADVDVSLGVRVEESRQEVTTYDLFSRGQEPTRAELNTTDPLPAASVVWRFREGMQARAAYSRTLIRPDLRELSTAPFDQVVGAGVFIGNPDLDRTTIDHFDLRWEWYLAGDETVSVGLFYKDLRDPIETVILGGANRTITLANADRGRNLGVELEFRKRFGFLADALEPLFLSSNLALIRSEVELDRTGIATSSKRPLAGQSPYVLNVAVGWDDVDSGTSVSLLYNVAGKRLVGIGTLGLPDVYEQPFHRVDLVASWTFWEAWTLRFQAENLLDQQVRLTQGGTTVETWREGRAFSLSLSAKF